MSCWIFDCKHVFQCVLSRKLVRLFVTPLHLLQNSTPHLLFSNANHSKQCLYFHNCFSSQSSGYWRKARCCCQQKRKPTILLHHWEILEVCPDDLKKQKCQEPQTCMPCHPQWAVILGTLEEAPENAVTWGPVHVSGQSYAVTMG